MDNAPGVPGIGAKTAARLVQRYGPIEAFPPEILGDQRERALLFKQLAILRRDAPVLRDVEELHWRGPTPEFAELVDRYGSPRLAERAARASGMAE